MSVLTEKPCRPFVVWDAATFDDELRAKLEAHGELVRNYYDTELELFREREAFPDRLLPPSNSYTGAFLRLADAINPMMQSRTIRAWHYTRMTDAEVEALARQGIELSTVATLRGRLDLRRTCRWRPRPTWTSCDRTRGT